MHSFAYKNGTLYCENVNLQELADKESTPLYVYSKQTILNHFHRLREALAPLNAEVAYAVKACSNIAILNLMARNGAGFDIVSGGELFRVLKAGGDPSKCTYAGVGKTEQEIRYALAQGIYCFNVESEAELRAINAIAASMGVKAPVAVRVNPNVEAGTHKYITTGKAENKFGVDFERIESLYEMAARELPNLHLKGLQMHIGSQLTQAKPFLEAVRKVAPLAASLKEKHGIEFFSIGGGIGIVYQGTLDSGVQEWWNEDCAQLTLSTYAQAVVPTLQPLGLHIIVEPGRLIVGNAGALITRCLYEKNGKAKTFKIVDAGMNDLIRPALYQGYHEIIPVREHPSGSCVTADVVGPICESGDFLAQNRDMPDVRQGELLAVLSARSLWFFHVFQLQFTAYGGRSPGGRGPMERHSQPPKLGRPHPGRIHSGITPPSLPSLECPSSGKTKEGHFLSTVLNGKQGGIFKSAKPRGASFRRRRTLLPYGLRRTGPAASHNDSNMNMSRKSVAPPACA